MINAPAISVPCGFTRDGLPVGLQIAGRWHDEVGVLRAAAAFEAAAPWAHHRPSKWAAPSGPASPQRSSAPAKPCRSSRTVDPESSSWRPA